MDKIEAALKPTPFKNIVNSIYGGNTCSVIVCQNKDCKAVIKREQVFKSLSIEVKNLKNVDESFKKYIESEIINDYKCEKCSQKVSISKRVLLKDLPNVLILHLCRFTFDMETF